MAKVVIIAPSNVDVSDAIKLLKGAGHDVDIEEPTPKSLLHIVLGLMGPNAYGFGPGYAYTGGPDAVDDLGLPGEEVPIEGEATLGDTDPAADLDGAGDIDIPADDLGDVEFNFEGVKVDGNPVSIHLADQDHTTLVVEELLVGPRTTYRLNESTFAFWPNDLSMPMQRVDVEESRVHTSLEVEIKKGDMTQLLIGRDLLKILKP